jgi:Transposase DNA-binding/Transposase Tn5 dimerisation domain
MEPVIPDTQCWAEMNFATADLGDLRRTKRLMILAAQVEADPSGSFPDQTGNWNDLRAAYNLFDCEDVTFEAVATPHWEHTKSTPGECLLILEDTTEIDYGPQRKVKDLSPVGSGTGQGFHLHSGLMVSPEDERIHGLAGQLIYHRKPVPKGETRTERLKRDDRESQIWCKLVDQIGSPPPGTTWVHVVDRGADDFEFYYHCQQTRTHWVARAKNLNRTVITPDGARQELYSYLQTLPEVGSFTLDLRARPNQPARTAKLAVACGKLIMPTPKLMSPTMRKLKPDPIPMHVVWVRELEPPEGAEPIEWVLYSSLQAEGLDGALLIVRYYEKRWLIEEWHKALKTGTAVQKRQLKEGQRLEAMVGLMSVVAVRLLQLKGEARTAPERPAEEVVPRKYVRALKLIRKLSDAVVMTVRSFFRELAKLGGFLGRRRDGEPGWITIWRGWEKLQDMIRGAHALAGFTI